MVELRTLRVLVDRIGPGSVADVPESTKSGSPCACTWSGLKGRRGGGVVEPGIEPLVDVGAGPGRPPGGGGAGPKSAVINPVVA
jgi:hypothetical protein